MQPTLARVQETVVGLSARLSRELGVPNRAFQCELVDTPYFASTVLSWPPATVRVTVSRELATSSVLGHEVTHGLIPTRWVFFAEGFATWKGCEIGGSCSDFLFAEADVDRVVLRRSAAEYVSIQRYIGETTVARRYFSPRHMAEFAVRHAHICAASFVKWLCSCHPALPSVIAGPECTAPIDAVTSLAGASVAELEARWLGSLREQGRAVARSGAEEQA